jgi:hypothetical protein
MNSFFASRRLLHEPAVCCSVSSSVPWFGVAQGSLPFVATKASPQRSSSCKRIDQGSKFFRRWRLDGFFRVPISPGSSSLWMPYYGLYSRGICWIDLLEEDCSRWNERLGFLVSLDRLCVPVAFPSIFLGGLMHRHLSRFFTNVCGKSTWDRVCRSRHPSFFAGSFLQSGILGFSPVFPFLLQSSFIMGQAFSVTRPFAVMEKGEKLYSTCGDESDNLENDKDVGGEEQQKRDASEAEHVNKDGTEHGTQEDDSNKISETLNNNVGLEELQHDAAPLGEHELPRAFSAKVDAEEMRGGDLEEESAPKVERQQVQEKAKAVEDELGPPPERPLPGDCCGQGCDVCVWDTYNDQLQEYNALKKALQNPK